MVDNLLNKTFYLFGDIDSTVMEKLLRHTAVMSQKYANFLPKIDKNIYLIMYLHFVFLVCYQRQPSQIMGMETC